MAGLDRKINLSTLHLEEETKNLPSEASSAIKEHQRKDNANRIRVTEKADRATTEQVLDPKTRMVLYKMINKKVFTEINGCVSTGKEVSHQIAIDHAFPYLVQSKRFNSSFC